MATFLIIGTLVFNVYSAIAHRDIEYNNLKKEISVLAKKVDHLERQHEDFEQLILNKLLGLNKHDLEGLVWLK